jgi:CheY-like chemotaxis protein
VKAECIAYRLQEERKISFIDFVQNESNLKGSNILVVEDSADNRDLIGLMLSREGAKVEFAENAETGIQRALRGRFDVILMDIQMPGLNGYEAVLKLRRSGYKGAIAALSARALTSDIEEGKSKGFDDYFTKPIDRPLLIRRLSRLRNVGGHFH